MRILVTGAAGFIGSHLCEKLVSNGHQVIGIDNFNDYYDVSLKELNASDLGKIGVEIIRLDLNDDLTTVFEIPFDYIFHLAAQPGISPSTALNEYVTNNIYATQNLLNHVLQYNNNVQMFVNIATSSVYGMSATVAENEETKPISFYGTTKLAAEQLVLAMQRSKKLKACSIRLYSVYGPRERPEKLYTKLISNLHQDKTFPLFDGSLKHQRSFTYVGDIVEGLAAIVDHVLAVNGEIINLGTDLVNTTQEGITFVEQIMNKKMQIEMLPPREGDQEKTAAIIDKARQLLQYSPKTTLKNGLEKQVSWYFEKFVN